MASKLINMPFEFIDRSERRTIAPLDLVEPFGHSRAQPFELGPLLRIQAFISQDAYSPFGKPPSAPMNAIVFTPEMSKRLRQRRFLQATLSSSRTM
jgi:hypothetical protein